MTRFVILHHRLTGSEHWDLMLEHEGSLLTWQLPGEPRGRDSLPLPARQIGRHRLAYLDYEGPVSGNRGDVRRVDGGDAIIHAVSPSACRFTLHGKRLAGDFRLTQRGDQWVLEVDDPG